MTSPRSYLRERSCFGGAVGLLLAAAMTLNGAGTALARPFSERLEGDEGASSAAEHTRNAAIRYQLGANAFRNARYREAVTHFLAADALVPSAALSYNTALAYDKLMETGRALAFYRDYLRRQPDCENSEEVAARIRELELQLMKTGVQQLTVLSEPLGAIVRIEDEPVGKTPWTGELEPGEHRLSVTLRGYQEGTRTVLLPAANAIDVLVRLEPIIVASDTATPDAGLEREPVKPAPVVRETLRVEPAVPVAVPAKRESRSSPNVVPWLTMGVGAAALAAAGTFQLLRQQSETEARSAITPEQKEKREDQAATYRTTSLILLGTGGGLVFTGGMLLLFGSSKDREPSANGDPAHHETARNAVVGCTFDGCYGSYRAQF